MLETTCPSASTATRSPACAGRERASTKPAFALEKPGDAPGRPDPLRRRLPRHPAQGEDARPPRRQWEKDGASSTWSPCARNKAHDALVAYVKRLRAQARRRRQAHRRARRRAKAPAARRQRPVAKPRTTTANTTAAMLAHHDVDARRTASGSCSCRCRACTARSPSLYLRVGSRFETAGGQRHLALPRAHGLPRHAVARVRRTTRRSRSSASAARSTRRPTSTTA